MVIVRIVRKSDRQEEAGGLPAISPGLSGATSGVDDGHSIHEPGGFAASVRLSLSGSRWHPFRVLFSYVVRFSRGIARASLDPALMAVKPSALKDLHAKCV